MQVMRLGMPFPSLSFLATYDPLLLNPLATYSTPNNKVSIGKLYHLKST